MSCGCELVCVCVCGGRVREGEKLIGGRMGCVGFFRVVGVCVNFG